VTDLKAEKATPELPERDLRESFRGWNGSSATESRPHGQAKSDTNGGSEPDAPNVLQIRNAGAIQTPPPRELLYGNQFARGFLSSLIAPGAVGKTTVRIAQCISAASNRGEILRQQVYQRCRVLILCFEDNIEELERRIIACCKHHKIDPEKDLDGWLYYDAPKGLRLAEMYSGTLMNGALVEDLQKNIEHFRPDIVVLDPLVKTHSLNENDNAQMDVVADMLAGIAAEYNIAVDAPHHTAKGRDAPGEADNARGASAIVNAARLAYTLTRMTEGDAKLFGIEPSECRKYLRLDSAKVNIFPAAQNATWFKLVSVVLDNGNDDYPLGDNVQTVEPWNPPRLWANISGQTANLILDEIDKGLPNGQRFSDFGAAKERAAWRVVEKHCPDKTEGQCRQIITAWLKSGALVKETYHDDVERKDRSGLRVDNSKRPT
jgi:hypothetical protein